MKICLFIRENKPMPGQTHLSFEVRRVKNEITGSYGRDTEPRMTKVVAPSCGELRPKTKFRPVGKCYAAMCKAFETVSSKSASPKGFGNVAAR